MNIQNIQVIKNYNNLTFYSRNSLKKNTNYNKNFKECSNPMYRSAIKSFEECSASEKICKIVGFPFVILACIGYLMFRNEDSFDV